MSRTLNELKVAFEDAPPPPPKRQPPPPPPKTEYPFHLIKVGGAARFPRAKNTVRAKLYEYLRTPQGKGQRFKLGAISPTMTRVWRFE